jgi:hypothetical protein
LLLYEALREPVGKLFQGSPDEASFTLRRQKAEGRGQKEIPINQFRGFNKDIVFFGLRVSKYISNFCS